MPLIERAVLGKLEILDDGQLQVREDTVIERNGEEVARVYHRRVLEPTEQVNVPSSEHATIKAISAVIWTPPVIAEYRRRKALPINGIINTGRNPNVPAE